MDESHFIECLLEQLVEIDVCEKIKMVSMD